jgi:Ricin-type beta-trefoil lectin domain
MITIIEVIEVATPSYNPEPEILENTPCIIKPLHSKQVLDIYRGNRANGTKVIQWDYHGGDNQIWYLKPVGDYYKIISKLNNNVLDVRGGSINNSADIITWPFHGGKNQLWSIKYDQKKKAHYIVAAHSGKCFDIYGHSYSKGAGLIQYSQHGGDNQRFIIEYK